MKLVIEAAALKALIRMPQRDAAAMRDKLKIFAEAPYAPHSWVKAFGANSGRIRHGDWRALYEIDGGKVTVTILKIGNRKEVYR